MRICSLYIKGYRGINAEIPWAGATVLFGPNDGGKTNVLDAIDAGLTLSGPARLDPYGDPDPEPPQLMIELELPALDVAGSVDQELLVRWTEGIEDWFFERPEGEEQIRRLQDCRDNIPRDPDGKGWAAAVDAYVDAFRACVRAFFEPVEASADKIARLVGSQTFMTDEGGNLFLVAPDRPPGDFSLDHFLSVGQVSERTEVARIIRPGLGTWSGLEKQIVEYLSGQWGPIAPPKPALERNESASLTPFFLRELIVGEGWLERDGDWVRVHPEVVEACRIIGEEATRLAPPFVRDRYRIEVVPVSPIEWRRVGGRISVRLVPHVAGHDQGFDLEVASTGAATWAGYAVAETIRRATQRRTESSEDRVAAAAPTIFLIDEPERHLHPLAQEEVAIWLGEIVREGASIVIATHAVPFLRFPITDTHYFRVTRRPDWNSDVKLIAPSVLDEVRDSAQALGLPPAAVLQLVRAWLVVEGEDDKDLLEALFGVELRRAGVVTLCLRGHGLLRSSLLNLQALSGLGIPFYLLLDNVRAEAVRTVQPVRPRTDEEHAIRNLQMELERMRRNGDQVEYMAFPWPDIICALPEQSVRALVQAEGKEPTAFHGWTTLRESHRQDGQRGINFKDFAIQELALPGANSATSLIRNCLSHWDGAVSDAHPLRRPVTELLAAITAE